MPKKHKNILNILFIFDRLLTLNLYMNLSKRASLKIAVVAIISIFMTSCFSIREIVHFNADGSGTFEVRTDISEIMSMIEMMEGMDLDEGGETDSDADLEEEEQSPIAEYAEMYKNQLEQVQSIPGISEAQVVEDEVSYLVGIYFKFKNAKALNAALNVLYADENKSKNREFFKVTKKKVERIDVVNMKDEVMKAMSEGDEMDDETLDMMRSMLSGVSFTTEYTFEKKVKKSNNSAAVIDGNSVKITQMLFNDQSKVTLNEVVKLK